MPVQPSCKLNMRMCHCHRQRLICASTKINNRGDTVSPSHWLGCGSVFLVCGELTELVLIFRRKVVSVLLSKDEPVRMYKRHECMYGYCITPLPAFAESEAFGFCTHWRSADAETRANQVSDRLHTQCELEPRPSPVHGRDQNITWNHCNVCVCSHTKKMPP